ncbi:MAG: caspase family protein [Lyngbya sp. HA4199-MV5]|jgi:WD40 repeat protein|nr:caspase family protein [Lyngbya sp. HA4199-MV5]
MSRDALVVGISTYQWLPGLSAPSHDAEAIAHRLQTDGDFRVVRMPEIIQAGQSRIGFKTQVTVAELEAALVKLFKPKGTNIPQTALFYFSGHGLQKDAGVQEGFLATSDANPNASFYGLSLFWLRRLLQESPVRQRIILLDCCHSGELLNFLEADPGARSGTDRLFMAASREYEAAYESMIGQYSVFTQALLDGLDPSRIVNGTVTNYALTDWVSNALKREMQQPLFENSGSEILLTRGQGTPAIVKTELVQDVCPYRGLEFFDEAHAEYFFGREDLTDQLIEKLRVGNFAAVVGASGSGKSSLMRAGLIHTLRQGKKFSGSDRWRIQLISPTEQPLKSLATAFVNPKDSAIDRAEQLRRAEALLRDGGTGLSHLVRASLMSAKHSRNSRLLLIIDQFEEVFTLCQGIQAERDRQSFFNSLLTALRELGDCFSVVVVLRADFFGKYSLYNGLAEQIEQHLVTVTPLTYQQIKASIVKPAEKAGIVCEPNLVYNILLDVVGAPGELPLLQYTLLELWQQRQLAPNGGPAHLTLDAYNELGGVRGTLQKRANDTFYSLTHDEQRVAKRIFIALTQIGDGTEDTRRRIAKAELVSPWFPAELVEQVLEKLVMAKLVVTNRLISTCSRQDPLTQRFANVSTALRFAQMRRGKCLQGAEHDRSASALSDDGVHYKLTGITHRSPHELADLVIGQSSNTDYQETVDVAHEALIRNWTLLRTWLDENRELLQRQRRMEHAAKEWYAAEESRSPEYLLHGDRLTEAEDYLIAYPDELSALAQRYIALSREENRRTQKERRLLQLTVPCTLLVALVVTFSQYRAVVKSQAEKDYQLQISTSREQAAVAQSILQEPESDPTTALLISRLAAEKGGYTYEAQASLRAALQRLRLQFSLNGQQGAIHQVTFSPDQRYLATAGDNGTVLLWSLETQRVETVFSWHGDAGQALSGANPVAARPKTPIAAIAFSPNGKQLAAIAQNSTEVQLWDVASGKRVQTLGGFKVPVSQLAFSPCGRWIAASAGSEVRVWEVQSGRSRATLRHAAPVTSVSFHPNDHALLTTSGTMAQLWQAGNWQRRSLFRHPASVRSATFSPDGQFVATASDDGKARLWLSQTGQIRRVLMLPNEGVTQGNKPLSLVRQAAQPLKQVLFSPNGRFLAAATAKHVQLWNVATSQPWQPLKADGDLGSGIDPEPHGVPQASVAGRFAFSPDSRQLVVASYGLGDDRSLAVARLWDVQTGALLSSLNGHSGAIEAVQFSGDNSLIATAGSDGATRVWATESGSEFPMLKTNHRPIQWAAFRQMPTQPQNKPIASTALARSSLLPQDLQATSAERFGGMVTVAVDGTLQSWNPTTFAMRPKGTDSAAFEPQGQLWSPARLAGKKLFNFLNFLGGSDAPTRSPQLPAVQSTSSLPNQLDFSVDRLALSSSAIAADSVRFVSQVTATAANPLQPEQPELARHSQRRLRQLLPSDAKLASVAFSLDAQMMATAAANGMVEIWQASPDKPLKRVGRLAAISSLLTPSSAVSKDGALNQFQVIRQLAFSPDRQTLLGVGNNQTIYVWEVSSGKLMQRLQGHEAAIEQAQFSPDSQRVVSASRDRSARIWQVASGKLMGTFYHRDVISSAHFSPDGELVAIASWDGTARILDAATGALRVVMAGHRGAVLDAEFSPDAATLVTASADGTIRLWDARTGTEQALLRSAVLGAAPEQIQQAFFSPDGRYVASLNQRGQLHLWAATWDELLLLARDRTLRQLKPEECLRYLRLSPNACPSLEGTVAE